jgi:hypothetical protein
MVEVTWEDISRWAQEHIEGKHCRRSVFAPGYQNCTTYEHQAREVNALLNREREECCKAVCGGCLLGWALRDEWTHVDEHGTYRGCSASKIRARSTAPKP